MKWMTWVRLDGSVRISRGDQRKVRFPQCLQFLRVCFNAHPFADRSMAGRNRVPLTGDLDQTKAARADRPKSIVVTKVGNVAVCAAQRIQNRQTCPNDDR
jgi:hypothetical protein